MKIDVYSTNLTRKASFFTCISLLWQPRYNEAGSFQIEFAEDSGVFGVIKPFDYITVDFDESIMLVTSIQYAKNKLIINGKSAIFLLKNRVSTTVVRNKNAETAMRDLIQNMTPWECVTLGESAGLTDKFTAQTSDGSIYEYCVKIAQAVDMGIRFRKSNNKLLFECYKPALNTGVKFAASLGNMGNETYTETELEYANVAVVAGAGSDAERITVTAGATNLSGAERREIYFDARHIQPEENESEAEYLSRLISYGEGKLSEMIKVQNTSFSIIDEKVKLGDLVTIKSVYSSSTYNARITSISYKSQNNKLLKNISVGTLIPTRKRG